MTTLQLRKSIYLSPLRRGILIPLALALFALPRMAQAVTPAPDGGYPNQNTAEGDNALFSLTIGRNNTASGFQALYSNTAGVDNTATGFQALHSNTDGSDNTATGLWALFSNTTGIENTATGVEALYSNTTGRRNTATGLGTLSSNTTGRDNTATGTFALDHNTTGIFNTATGVEALESNSTGFKNTASGVFALQSNTTGHDNTAAGYQALLNNSTGFFNIAIGSGAGANLTSGTNNIVIDHPGVTGDTKTIRIGTPGKQIATFVAGIRGTTTANGNAVPVVIDSAGQLGTVSSSQRFKSDIQQMDSTSEAVLKLKPVTFHYKSDKQDTLQFGLIAEEVAKVNPNLVVRNDNGEIYTVRYEAVNAMLLNEFLKEHRRAQVQERKVEEQGATIAQQRKAIAALATQLKEQAALIRRVSDRVEASKEALSQVVLNNQ